MPTDRRVERDQPRAAVVYLTQNIPARRRYLHTSLRLLFRSFNARCGYPVIVLHEGDFTEESIASVRRELPRDQGDLLHFHALESDDFLAPVGVLEHVVATHRIIVPDAPGLKYRTMCRWWIRHAAKYLGSFEYYMRLDDDSFIEETLDYDPFRVVRDAQVDYASNLVHIEHPLNALGLLEFSVNFLGGGDRLQSLFLHGEVAQSVDPARLAAFLARIPLRLREFVPDGDLSCPIMYYNNFHIARTSLWRNPVIAQYFAAVEESAGVYHFRWGDAPLQTIALVAAERLKLGRLDFRYSKRYEREQGRYVNTRHPIAARYFVRGALVPIKGAGSMTDFEPFNDLLAARGLSDITQIHASRG
jgi:hypothetical protein